MVSRVMSQSKPLRLKLAENYTAYLTHNRTQLRFINTDKQPDLLEFEYSFNVTAEYINFFEKVICGADVKTLLEASDNMLLFFQFVKALREKKILIT